MIGIGLWDDYVPSLIGVFIVWVVSDGVWVGKTVISDVGYQSTAYLSNPLHNLREGIVLPRDFELKRACERRRPQAVVDRKLLVELVYGLNVRSVGFVVEPRLVVFELKCARFTVNSSIPTL